jgi:tetratricopeptide (TPR) repeat protein
LFALQDKLTAMVRASLRLRLDGQAAPARRPALTAYELYMRGRRLFLRREKGSMDEAHDLYEEAVRLEPDYALALSELARFYGMRYVFTTSRETLDLAERYSRRAIASDPSLPDGYTWLAYALWRQGSSREAYNEWMRSMALDPSGYFPYYFGGSIGHLIGTPDNGLAHLQHAVALEPQLASSWLALGCLHTQLGHHPEALSCFDRATRVDRAGDTPRWPGLGGFHAECLRRDGQLTHARRVCLEALEDVEKSDHMYRDSNRVVCLVTLGRIALQQQDVAAARAAYGQAIAHVNGRPRTLAGGWLVTQALAGLAASGEGRPSYDEAARLYERRDRFDFSWLWFCTAETTSRDLAGAAMALGIEGLQ